VQKKEKKQANKLKQVAKKEAGPVVVASSSAAKPTSTSNSTKLADDDPEGKKLAAKEPLVEAYKYLRTLLKFSPDDVEVQLLACKVNLRRQKYLQVVQALNRAIKVAPDHPEIHQQAIELGLAVAGLTSNDTVASLLREESSRLLSGKTPAQANDEFIAQLTSRTHAHRRVAAEALLRISADKKSDALSLCKLTLNYAMRR